MRKPQRAGIGLIAVFKVLKGLLLLIVSLGLLPLVHGELATFFSLLLEALHLDANSRLLHSLVLRVDALQPHDVLMISLVSLGYAAVFLTEGIGLWYEWSWAALLAVISTGFFVPFELYELVKQFTVGGFAVLLVNLLIVAYLVAQLKRHTLRSRRRKMAPSAPTLSTIRVGSDSGPVSCDEKESGCGDRRG